MMPASTSTPTSTTGPAVSPAPSALSPRTRLLLDGPIAATLLRLAAPNVLVMVAQASAGMIETYFIGKLGTDALAGVALVFPAVMLMQMMSAGAIGGGIASAIARALGGGRRAEADALVDHAIVVGLGFGVVFMLTMLLGGPWLYREMGGQGASLATALTYSNWVFSGALLFWLFNSLAAIIRGTGNMTLPAVVVSAGTLVLIPLSPLLIFGHGPVPGLGIAGGAVALLFFYGGGSLVLLGYLLSRRSLLRPTFRGLFRMQRKLLVDIMRVGAGGVVSTLSTNLAIGIATTLVGRFGPAAIAGYGTASRIEYLLVPLVFGLGAPLVAIVGTSVGAGRHERALRATWIAAAMAVALTETVGLAAAIFPRQWLSLFGTDPAMLEAGTLYLRAVGPMYGFFGLGLVLYFASQGAGRLMWPVIGNLVRLAVAATGGWLALSLGGGLTALFLAQGLALVAYGVVNASAIAGGAWFGPIGWPRTTAGLVARLRAP